MQETVAVLGASGQSGRAIVRELIERYGGCRAVGRTLETLRRHFADEPRVELRTWNPELPATIAPALEGADTVIYLVAVPYNRFALHPLYMQRTLDAIRACGVARILLISPVYSYGRPQRPFVAEDHPREPHTRKGRFRKIQEDLVLDAHANGFVQGAILRVPDFFGPGAPLSIVNDVFLAATQGRRANLLGPIETPHQFCYVPDLGRLVARLIAQPRAYGRAWNFAGSGTVSQKILGDEAFRRAGTKPRYFALGSAALATIGLFNPIMRELIEMSYLHTAPVLLDDRDLRRLLDGFSATDYVTAIDRTLAALP